MITSLLITFFKLFQFLDTNMSRILVYCKETTYICIITNNLNTLSWKIKLKNSKSEKLTGG